MPMKKKYIILFVLLLLVAGSYTVYRFLFQNNSEGVLTYTGTVEVVEVLPSFQIAGKVNRVSFEEGQAIEPAQILATVDDAELSGQHSKAKANLEAVRSRLESLRTYARYLTRSVEARIKAAQADLNKVSRGPRPQEVESARQAVNQAQAQYELTTEKAERTEKLYQQEVIPLVRRDEALRAAEAAEAVLRQAEEALDLAEEGSRQEDVEIARASLASAQAERERVKRAWMEVTSAEYQVELAEAELRLAETRLDHATVRSSISGIVLSKSIEVGETALPGSPIASIADLSTVRVRFYVEEERLGHLNLGGTVKIRSDSFPEKSFTGKISFLSDKAEFTPKTIQTREERTKLVFLAKVTADNPGQALKPGMPVDVILEEKR
jgi:HlyD family secretion protein